MKLSEFIKRLQDLQSVVEGDPYVVITDIDSDVMELAAVEVQNCKVIDYHEWIVLDGPNNPDQVIKVF